MYEKCEEHGKQVYPFQKKWEGQTKDFDFRNAGPKAIEQLEIIYHVLDNFKKLKALYEGHQKKETQ